MAAGTPLPDGVHPGDDLLARGRAHAADAVERPDFPSSEIDQARHAAAALAAPEGRDDDIRAAVAAVEEHAHVDGIPPVDANRRSTAFAKRIVRRAVHFSNHHLAAQVSGLGWAATWLGSAAADRIEALEREVAELRARIERLEGDGPNP